MMWSDIVQVHELYVIGPGVYSFGVALQAHSTALQVKDAVASGAALRASWLRKLDASAAAT
jgi:hypothetical protein